MRHFATFCLLLAAVLPHQASADGPGCDTTTREIAQHFCGHERGERCLHCLRPHAGIFREAKCSVSDIQRLCFYGDDRGGDGIHGDTRLTAAERGDMREHNQEEEVPTSARQLDDDETWEHKHPTTRRPTRQPTSPTKPPTLVRSDDDLDDDAKSVATHLDDDDAKYQAVHKISYARPKILHKTHILKTVPHKCWQGVYNLCKEGDGLNCQNCCGSNWPILSGQYFCTLDDIDKFCNEVDDDEGVRELDKQMIAEQKAHAARKRPSVSGKLGCHEQFERSGCESVIGIKCEHCTGNHINEFFTAGCNFHELNHMCSPETAQAMERRCGHAPKGLKCDNCAGANWPELVSHGKCSVRDIDAFCERQREPVPVHKAVTVDSTKNCHDNLNDICRGETGIHCDNCVGKIWPMLFNLGCRMSTVDTFCNHLSGSNKCQVDLKNLCSGDKGLTCDDCAQASWPQLARAGCKMHDVDNFCIHQHEMNHPRNQQMTGTCQADLNILCGRKTGLHCDDCAGQHWRYLTRIGCNFHELNRFCAGGGSVREEAQKFPKGLSCHDRMARVCSGKEGLHCDDCAGAHWPSLSSSGKCTMRDVDMFCNTKIHTNHHTDSEISPKRSCYENLKRVCGIETGLHCDNCAGAHWATLFASGCKLADVDSFCNHLDD